MKKIISLLDRAYARLITSSFLKYILFWPPRLSLATIANALQSLVYCRKLIGVFVAYAQYIVLVAVARRFGKGQYELLPDYAVKGIGHCIVGLLDCFIAKLVAIYVGYSASKTMLLQGVGAIALPENIDIVLQFVFVVCICAFLAGYLDVLLSAGTNVTHETYEAHKKTIKGQIAAQIYNINYVVLGAVWYFGTLVNL